MMERSCLDGTDLKDFFTRNNFAFEVHSATCETLWLNNNVKIGFGILLVAKLPFETSNPFEDAYPKEEMEEFYDRVFTQLPILDTDFTGCELRPVDSEGFDGLNGEMIPIENPEEYSVFLCNFYLSPDDELFNQEKFIQLFRQGI